VFGCSTNDCAVGYIIKPVVNWILNLTGKYDMCERIYVI